MSSTSLFARRPVADLLREGEGPSLDRSLGAPSLVALGVGAIIGAGLFSLTGIAAAENAGPAVVLSFLVAAAGCALAGTCYAELASTIPVAGSAYTYAAATLGELVAWIIGWDLVLEYAVGAGAVAVSWSQYVVALLHGWGIDLPVRWTASPFELVAGPGGGQVHGLCNLPALVVLTAVSALLLRGVRESAGVNAAIVVVKLAVVLAVIGFGAPSVHLANWHPFVPPNAGEFGHFGFSGVLRGAGVVFFAYIGFDAVSTAAGETRDPQRAMPVGILGSLAVCTVLYVGVGLVLTGLVGTAELHGDAHPAATAVARTPFPWLAPLVTLGVLCGFTTVLLVMLLGQSRVFHAMAGDGLLPRGLAAVHPRRRTPWRASLAAAAMSCALGGFVPISVLGHMTSIGTLLAFCIACAGVLILRRTDPDLPRGYRAPFCPLVPLAGIAVCLAMMASLGLGTWIRLLAWLALGLAIYFGYGRARSRLARGAG